ncbi:Uncharacterised protein [Bordetella ansorpii]|uniref:Uncharacterized protein n=1 Tax=Bordetella ansorpii TaxID=288768 RepID=A0A157P869_9BORD|nr:Uncharacterised protein [Bordetella ansorpii]
MTRAVPGECGTPLADFVRLTKPDTGGGPPPPGTALACPPMC